MNHCFLDICRLREWVSKQAEREKEKAEKRRERMERRKSGPKHNFDDPDYEKQKTIVTENLEDALQHGNVLLHLECNCVYIL